GDAGGVPAPEVERRSVVGVLGEVAGERTAALSAEALHAAGDVGGKSPPRLLAVVADVDAPPQAPPPALAHRRLRLPGQLALVDRLAAVLSHEEVAERRASRDAADVGDEDPIAAGEHVSSRPGRRRPFPAASQWPRGTRASRCTGSPTGRSRSRRG